MWLTRKQFEQEQIEREINFMACEDYRKKSLDDIRYPSKTRMFAASVAMDRYLKNIKNIREANPYKGLYFFKIDDDEGIHFFDKFIEYRNFRILHYQIGMTFDYPLYAWSFSFEFPFEKKKIKIKGTFLENFDLIEIMSLIDEFYKCNLTMDKYYIRERIEKAGGYIDD